MAFGDKDLDRLIAEADQFPLGSMENPVRVFMPDGEQAYLSRLRDSDGDPVLFHRLGSMGTGVFDNVIDRYLVTAPVKGEEPRHIHFDMYHQRFEDRPVDGYGIVPRQDYHH